MYSSTTYHLEGHEIEAAIKKFDQTENHGEFCSLNVDFVGINGERVTAFSILIPGKIEDARIKLAALKAVL